MTGQYEADSLLLGWRAAYALAAENTTPPACQRDFWCRDPGDDVLKGGM